MSALFFETNFASTLPLCVHPRAEADIRRAPLRRFPFNVYYLPPHLDPVVYLLGSVPGQADPAAILDELVERLP